MTKHSKILTILLLLISFVTMSVSTALASNTVTWNPSDKGSNVGLSNNNLTVGFNNPNGFVRATTGVTTGKWYWECTLNSNYSTFIGVVNGTDPNTASLTDTATGSERIYFMYGADKIYGAGQTIAYGSGTGGNGVVVGVALDMIDGTITFYKNGVNFGVAFTDLKTLGALYPTWGSGTYTGTGGTANFGASAFSYAVPTGYLPYNDTNLPSTPNGLALNSTTLSWSANPTSDNITSYTIYNGNNSLGSVTAPTTSYSIASLPSGIYNLSVSATNALGSSTKSSPVAYQTAPSTPIGLHTNSTTLSWTTNPAADNITSYTIYNNGTSIGTSTSPNYSLTSLASGVYSLSVSATNSSGTSTKSSTTSYQTGPTNLQASLISDSDFTLSFTPNPYILNPTGFNIYINNQKYGSTIASSPQDITGLSPSTTYSITVTELNSSGESSPSAPLSLSTPARIAPPSPPQQGSTSSCSTTLIWTPYPNAVYYNIYQDNIKIATTPLTTYTVYNLIPGTSYSFTITASLLNDLGVLQESTPSSPITVSTTTLTQPQATPVTATSSTIDWPTPSDSIPGTTIYTIYANGTPIETTTLNLVTVHNLAPDTIYSITIAYTPENSSTPQDLDPIEITTPSQITSPAPTQTQSANTTATSTTLNWQPPSGIIPINTIYKVYVNAILVGTTPSPFYIVPLQPATTSTVTVVTSTITDTIPAYTDPSTGITTPQSYTTVDSQPSSGIIVTTPLLSDIPSNDITPTIETPYSITLNWPSYPGALSYNIYQNTVLIDTTTAITYTINNLQPKTQYTFQITINTPTGEQDPFAPIIMTSPPSNTIQGSGDTSLLNTIQGSGNASPVILCSPDHTQYYDPIAKAVIIMNVPIVASQSDLDTLRQQNKSTSTFEFLMINASNN